MVITNTGLSVDAVAPDAVVIVGAGLLGSLFAWRLARQQPQLAAAITVLEKSPRDQLQSAANTAAAMVAPYAERNVCDSDMFELGKQSLSLWPALLTQLSQDSGQQVAYGQSGSLVVAHQADQSELRQFEQEMAAFQLLGGNTAQLLNRQQIQQLEPGINSEFQSGFYLPQEMHLDNRALLPLLHAQAEQSGVNFFFDCDVSDEQLLQYPATTLVIDCRGVGAKQALHNDDQLLRGVRGEVCWIETSEVTITRPVRLLHPRYHLYLVPKGQTEQGAYRYILGATEIESEDQSPVSVRSQLEMLSALYCLSPALAEARIIETDVNLRPAFPDHKPKAIRAANNLYRLNGLFRHGYLLAPAFLQQFEQQLKADYGLSLGLAELLGSEELLATESIIEEIA
ncbi:FAD-dependent oxidoreductase [Bacterioplanoides sp.]|uniref:FAD-dependent oxidoreductase n=1 Tax=Bacterioplanoides sp. TaxID=2066072 RepID=UPI003B00A261